MSKALYAMGFMAMCCVILVIHETSDQEEAKLSTDPFLASVEARVVAVAQHRLKLRLADDAAQKHVSEARKAIKASLMDADADNQLHIQKYNAEQQLLAESEEPKAAAKTAADAPAPHKKAKKQFTWAEMQAGDDAAEEDDKVVKADTSKLMNGLMAAPKVSPDEASTEGANMITASLSEEDEQVPEKEAEQVTATADVEDEDEDEAPPAEEEVQEEEEVEEEKQKKKTAKKKKKTRMPRVAKKHAAPRKKAQKPAALLAAKKPNDKKNQKPAAKKKTAKKSSAKKVLAHVAKIAKKVKNKKDTEVKPSVPEEEQYVAPVADGYKEENEYGSYDEPDAY